MNTTQLQDMLESVRMDMAASQRAIAEMRSVEAYIQRRRALNGKSQRSYDNVLFEVRQDLAEATNILSELRGVESYLLRKLKGNRGGEPFDPRSACGNNVAPTQPVTSSSPSPLPESANTQHSDSVVEFDPIHSRPKPAGQKLMPHTKPAAMRDRRAPMPTEKPRLRPLPMQEPDANVTVEFGPDGFPMTEPSTGMSWGAENCELPGREQRHRSYSGTQLDARRGTYDETTVPSLTGQCRTPRGAFSVLAGYRDAVDCTVFAPSEVRAGDSLLVQVFAHLPDLASNAADMAREFDSDAVRRGFMCLATEIVHGSRLCFELSLPGVIFSEPQVRELTWIGRTTSVQFDIPVPPELSPRNINGTVLVTQDTVPIGTVCFKLKITEAPSASAAGSAPTEAKRYQVAFASYASPDRPEVVRRIQMLAAAGIRCFQDILDLDPGDRWQRELFRYIDESDVLFLFWSTAAKSSEWVEREWRYGLERRGIDFIRPVVVEGPPIVPPPQELAELHFSDRHLYFLMRPPPPSPVENVL